MVGMGLVATSIAVTLMFMIIPAYAQTTITDIENDPVAQDILNKIEETKKWLEELEQKQAKILAESKELEEKRTQAKESLEADLKEWEKLWEQYSSKNVFTKFVERIPSNATKAVFWDHYDFTQSKIQAGRDAFNEVTNRGGDFQEAYAAYLKAAEIKKIEMIQVNSMYNVVHGLAYYNQQILFNPDGQFDLELSGEQLRKYYEDYRTDPQYLLANPDDKLSWKDLGETNPDTECRVGYTLVYRYHASDYVCTTERTAEMWIRHGMGKPISQDITVEPDIVNIEQMNYDRIQEKVVSVNSKIQGMQKTLEVKTEDMEKKYDMMMIQMEVDKKDEEKKVTAMFNKDEISKDNFSDQITDIRAKYKELEKTMIKEKFQTMDILEKSHKQNLDTLVERYDDDQEIKIRWNSSTDSFEAQMAT